MSARSHLAEYEHFKYFREHFKWTLSMSLEWKKNQLPHFSNKNSKTSWKIFFSKKAIQIIHYNRHGLCSSRKSTGFAFVLCLTCIFTFTCHNSSWFLLSFFSSSFFIGKGCYGGSWRTNITQPGEKEGENIPDSGNSLKKSGNQEKKYCVQQ